MTDSTSPGPYLYACPSKLARNLERIDARGLPPGPLISSAMSRAVMDMAERYREFIARPTAKCARLDKPQVMRIRRLAGAQEAWLEGDVAKVLGSVARVDALRTLNRSW